MKFIGENEDMFTMVIEQLEAEQNYVYIHTNLKDKLVKCEVLFAESVLVPVENVEVLFAYLNVCILDNKYNGSEAFRTIDWQDIEYIELEPVGA